MRILYLSSAGEIGGGNRSLLTLWSELKSKGVKMETFCPAYGPMVDVCLGKGVTPHVANYLDSANMGGLSLLKIGLFWINFLKKEKPDLVHANDIRSARSIILACRLLKVPLVCHVRFPPTPAGINWCFRWLPKPDAFIFVSHNLQEKVGMDFKLACPESLQRVVHNGVDLNEFVSNSSQKHSRIRVGIIANFIPVKGHELFLEIACELFKVRGIPAEFAIVGYDIHKTRYGEKLESIAKQKGIWDVTKFLGFSHDIPSIMNELDILVSCSQEEPFGRSICEAMACGLPVVATAVGGCLN